MVVVGAGSFTSTRVACVVANTFAFVLQIPLLAISLKQAQNPQKLIPKLLKQKKGNYLSATYSGEPNIGRK
jgi:tRNA A37 threonylcarbamoyladenosine modification protein TsaB